VFITVLKIARHDIENVHKSCEIKCSLWGDTESTCLTIYTACKGVLFISFYFCRTQKNVRIEEV